MWALLDNVLARRGRTVARKVNQHPSLFYFSLRHKMILRPSTPLSLISVQLIIHHRGHQRHNNKVHCHQPSNSYEGRGLSSTDSSDWEQIGTRRGPTHEREQLHRIHLRSKGGLTLRLSGCTHPHDIGDESTDVETASTDGEHCDSGVHMFPSNPTDRLPATMAKAKIQTNQLPEPDNFPLTLAPATREKPKSETYKGAWSVSE
ncbi:hypothetical protein EDB83DRAFT_48112 [Lactarius deliciosus]|nr:hypothetical protein EDB83DRAFT_48112 [Lactarius deliciosus]